MDIAELLAFSVKSGASDLHLSAGLPPMIRVDGEMQRINVAQMYSAIQTGRRDGMQTLDQNLKELVDKGVFY